MANACYYEMLIKGRREDCEKWIERTRDEICYEGGDDNEWFMKIEGYCDWSLEICYRNPKYSDGKDFFTANTEELNLIIEAWSEEPLMGFQEHYIYDHGKCILDECFNWIEAYFNKYEYPTFSDFKSAYGIPEHITEDDLDENGCYIVGAVSDYTFQIEQK